MAETALGPVSPSERIELLDVLRGFALIGVLYVNMHNFGAWIVERGPVHGIASFFLGTFFEGKFYTLFSLLFGIGFALQLRRATARGSSLFRFYWRRLVVLFGLGWAHALIYPGDIVRLYAVVGFALFFFKRWRPRHLVAAALVILALDHVAYLEREGYVDLLPSATEGVEQTALVESESELRDAPVNPDADPRRIREDGSFSEVVHLNLRNAGNWWRQLPFGRGPGSLAVFLIGMAILRAGIVDNVEAHRARIRQAMWWLGCIGLPGSAYSAYVVFVVDLPESSIWTRVEPTIFAICIPALALAYASFIALHLYDAKWRRLLQPLAAVGRVPLSAYVGQSVVYTTIYYGYGFGFYGRLGPAHILPLAALVFTTEVLICNWWIRRFRYGPLEWLWRSLTYLKWQPMRVRP